MAGSESSMAPRRITPTIPGLPQSLQTRPPRRDSRDLQDYATIPLYKPEDLAATIYHALGIDHEMRLPDTQGRPVGIMDDGQPIMELFG